MSGLTATPKRKAGAAFAVLALLASLMIGFANPASAASTVTPKGLSIGGTIYGTYNGGNISPSAGLIGVDTDGNGSVDAYAYCIDLGHPLANNSTYTEGTWDASNVPNLGKITWILQNYPASGATPQSTAMAVQAAIWHFSDGFNLAIDGTNSGNSKAIEDLYSSILANATNVPEPHPTLTITPSTQSGEIQTGLVYDVASTAPGPVALSLSGGPAGTKILPVKGDGTCDTAASPITSVNLVGGAAKVCLYSADPGADATLTGTVTEATASGRVFLYAPNPNGKQKLIFAGGGTVSASATAKGTWVETAQPRTSGAVVCSAQGGTITVTLANDGNGNVAFDVYTPNTDTLAQTVNVGAHDSKTVDFANLPDGTYGVKIIAKYDGKNVDTSLSNLVVDCQPKPVVEGKVTCADNDGTITVTLKNDGPGEITYEVTNPVTQQVTTKTVGARSTDTVTFTGVPDGTHDVPVVAQIAGKADQDLTIKGLVVNCDAPGAPVIENSVVCASNDGTVTLTLKNTGTPGKAKAVHFVVYDRDGTTVVWEGDVAAGGQRVQTFEGVPDGTWTYKLTADGQDLSQTLTVQCDAPGVPVVSSSVECTATGGQVSVTLTNDGTEGKNLPVTFRVTDPRNGTSQDVTVEPGATEKVVLTGFADGAWTIPVSVGETSYAQKVDVACSRPVVEGITLECAQGGIVVGLGNEGTNPTTMVVRKGDTVVTTVEVAPGATTEVLVPMTEDEKATVTVTSNGEIVGQQTLTYDCQNPTTTSTSTTAEVAGVTQTPVTPRGALPYTGGDVLRTALLGLGLAAAGFGLVVATRRRRS